MAHPLLNRDIARRKERLLAQARGRVLTLEPTLHPNEDGVFDTIVSVHTLCVVDDVDAAVRRIDELLAPDGQVLVLEHVRATGLRGRNQDAWTPLWRLTPFGCHANRDVVGALRANGFAVTDLDRFRTTRVLPIVAGHISAVAIRKVVTQ